MPLKVEGFALAAARVRADYLVRDPSGATGTEQEILRMNE